MHQTDLLPAAAPRARPTQTLQPLVWRWLGGRRGLIIGGVALVAAGLALNWSWLTAIGVAPVLVAAAPCAVMCGLGWCMPRMMGGNSCAPGGAAGNTPGQTAGSGPEPALAPPGAEPLPK